MSLSARKRKGMDLRNSPEDLSRRMLNALEPGTVMPIHRHRGSSETVVILRGKIRWIFYDENGVETERVVLDADGEPRMLNVEKDRWLISMTESGNPRENAIAERVNGILKTEWLNDEHFAGINDARRRTAEVIEIYNNKRPHMS